MKKLTQLLVFLRKAYSLARPYGLKRLGFLFAIILAQGLFQVIGVTSIFPFLALAADPGLIRDSETGQAVLAHLPEMDNQQLLVLAGGFAIAMLLLSNLLMITGEVARARYAHGFGHWLRLRLLSRIVSNPYGYFLQRNTGELLKKTVSDVTAYVLGVLSPLLDGMARLITVTFLLGTLILVNPWIAISAGLLIGTFYITVFSLLNSRRIATSESLKMANRGAMREAQQLLGGIKPIKVHGVESPFIDRYSKHSFIQSVLFKWFPIYQNSPRYLIEPIAFGGVVAIVVIMAAQGEDFSSLLPTLGVMAIAGYRLIPNLQLLYSAATGITLMMHSLEEVYDEFHQVEAEEAKPLPRTGMVLPQIEWKDRIELRNVSFSYSGAERPTIDNLNLTVRRNQFVAFIGQTGSGKSTLIDLILGLHWPDSGQILVDGEALTHETIRNWRAGIGYVPQDIFLLDDTIAANIAFGVGEKAIDMDRVRQSAEVAQIREFIEKEMPGGFMSLVGERGVRLSGGQRQRIGLARALYHQPSMLLLDEATSALDATTEAALMKAIENLYGKMTLLVIAHRLTTIKRADWIYSLDHGRIAEQGTYDDLGLEMKEELTRAK